MKKRRNWFAPLSVLVLTGLLVWSLGRLVRPKYASGLTLEGSMVENWYAHAGEGHQVLFIGDCEVYESFSPAALYAEYGATSYIRGSAQQLMWQSYYLLREALQKETPRAVVLSICSLRYAEPQSEAYNRMTLDGMRFGRNKIEAVRASLLEGESELSYYVPLLRYHDRLFELAPEDAQYLFAGPELTYNGYLMRTETVPYTWLPQAPVLYPVKARQDGYLSHVNGTALGLAAQRMGAGRISKADIIDPAVGFVMEKRIGDCVKAGDTVCTLHAASEQNAKETEQRILDALTFTNEPAPKARLLYALVKPEGVTELSE